MGILTAKKYVLNENYFKKLDTLAKLYILGWIYSDGNVFLIKIRGMHPDYTKGSEYSKVTCTN